MSARVRLSAGRSRPSSPLSRREAVIAALTASGEELVTNYDLTRGTQAERFFHAATLGVGHRDLDHSNWPSEAGFVDPPNAETLFRDGANFVYRFEDGTLAYLSVSGGWAHVCVAAVSKDLSVGTLAVFQALYPPTYLDATDSRVPVTFWMHGTYGPERRLRMIDASPWADIARNYAPSIRGELDALMTKFEPGKGGQLLLWQGEPGTAKTWCIRALVSEWLPWAEFHYITDPDVFFVERPSYMVDVLLADSYGTIDQATGDVYEDEDPLGKWRVLILEDTGELLSVNAKEKYGQGLSRLLNVVDGMIGQGLRVLCLVTTNDELGELTPAVRRPGRCASQIVFPPFSASEASEWLGEDVEAGGTVAELYARRGDATDALEAEPAEEFSPSAEDVAANDVRAAIFGVAKAHAEEMVGYGETAYDEDSKTVLYVCGDWTDPDPIDADFLAIDGVEAVEHEAEALPGGWWDAEVVYPEDPPRWVTESPGNAEAALQAVIELAGRPLV